MIQWLNECAQVTVNVIRSGARKKIKGDQIKRLILKGVKISRERLEKIFLAGAPASPCLRH